MKISDFISVKATETFGNRKVYDASIGEFRAAGPTRAAAISALKEEIITTSKSLGKFKVYRGKDVHVLFIVHYGIGGWEYEIFDMIFCKSSICLMGNGATFESTCEAARKHAESYS